MDVAPDFNGKPVSIKGNSFIFCFKAGYTIEKDWKGVSPSDFLKILYIWEVCPNLKYLGLSFAFLFLPCKGSTIEGWAIEL